MEDIITHVIHVDNEDWREKFYTLYESKLFTAIENIKNGIYEKLRLEINCERCSSLNGCIYRLEIRDVFFEHRSNANFYKETIYKLDDEYLIVLKITVPSPFAEFWEIGDPPLSQSYIDIRTIQPFCLHDINNIFNTRFIVNTHEHLKEEVDLIFRIPNIPNEIRTEIVKCHLDKLLINDLIHMLDNPLICDYYALRLSYPEYTNANDKFLFCILYFIIPLYRLNKHTKLRGNYTIQDENMITIRFSPNLISKILNTNKEEKCFYIPEVNKIAHFTVKDKVFLKFDSL